MTVTIAIIAALVIVCFGLEAHIAKPKIRAWRERLAERRRSAHEVREYRTKVLGEVKEPLPYDPDNPPRKVVYRPRDLSRVKHCYCHGRVVTPEQTVWLWPDGEAVRIICDDAKMEASP